MGLDISRISTYRDYNIIGYHRNVILPDEESNNFSKPGLDTTFKPNLDITQFAKYIFNDPLNLNPNTASSNFRANTMVYTQPYQSVVRRDKPA